jgi:hypothetical protein
LLRSALTLRNAWALRGCRMSPGRAPPVVAALPLATPPAAPVRRALTAQASAAIGENALIIREFAVTEDIPPNSWAPMAITSTSLAPVSPIALART